MPLTTAGVNFLAQAAVGQGVPFNATNAYIGVGDGSGAFSVNDTDLQGVNKFRKGMDSGFPEVHPPAIIFKSTFEPSEANFDWKEWGIFNGAQDGVMLSRSIESNGTKQSNQTWVLEIAVTFMIGT